MVTPALDETKKSDDKQIRRVARILKGRGTDSLQVEDDPFDNLYQKGGAVPPPLNPRALLQLSEANTIHEACLNAKADDSVGHGWHLEARPGVDMEEEDIRKRERELENLLKSIVGEFGFRELLWAAAFELGAIGWSAWEVAGDAKDISKRRLYPIQAHSLRVTKDPDKFVQLAGEKAAYFSRFGSGKFYDRTNGNQLSGNSESAGSQLIWFRAYSPSNKWYGTPRWISAIPTMTEMAGIREYNTSFFDSGGMADSIIHVEADSESEAERIAGDIENSIHATRALAHVNILTYGTKDTKIQATEINKRTGSPREGGFQKRDESLQKQVMISHNVPPYRIGLAELGSLGGNAAKEMLRAYRYGSIEPLQGVIESRLESTIFNPAFGGIDLGPDLAFRLDDIDWEQLERELDVEEAVETVRNAIRTPNEARELLRLGQSDEPAMDRHYFQGVVLGQDPSGGSGADIIDDLSLFFDEEETEIEIEEDVAKRYNGDTGLARAFTKQATDVDAAVARHTPGLRKVLESEADIVAREVGRASTGKGAIRAAEAAIAGRRASIDKWRRETYTKTAEEFAFRFHREMTRATKKAAGDEQEILPPSAIPARVRNEWKESTLSYLRSDAGKKITGEIVKTTIDRVREELAEGVRAGEGVDVLKKRIKGLYGEEIIPNRAEVITRTEVGTAANLGSDIAARKTGVALEKRWLSSRDDRTRATHVAEDLSNTWIPHDEPFEVGGELLMYPLDSSLGASPENTIQCRCVPLYRRAQSLPVD